MGQPRTNVSGASLALFFFISALCSVVRAHAADSSDRVERNRTLLDKLVASYPDFLASHDGHTLRWKDGTTMSFDDGKGEKDFETRLDHRDLEDEFYAPIPPVAQAFLPPSTSIPDASVTNRSSPRCMATARRGRSRRNSSMSPGFPSTVEQNSR